MINTDKKVKKTRYAMTLYFSPEEHKAFKVALAQREERAASVVRKLVAEWVKNGA